MYAWGSSQFGQLGLGPVQESPYPRLVVSLSGYRVVSAECGQYHTLYLTSSGSVLACGWNVHGQLGLGTIENVRVPVVVHTLKEHVSIFYFYFCFDGDCRVQRLVLGKLISVIPLSFTEPTQIAQICDILLAEEDSDYIGREAGIW